ncbi:MAG TPA: nitrate- and nitrite sensing domain-containing protein [Candidatus Limnocylindrales bacterium]|nr:nitrate- and nitrite sensing domain-containing protein [Candidatus Limnocylindrales bacterium]
MRIAKKLLVLVTVPLVAVAAFAAVAVTVSSGQALQAERLRLLVIAGGEAGELAHRLQAERVAAVDALVARPSGAVDRYLATATTTDEAVGAFRRAKAKLQALPESVAHLLDRVERQLSQMEALRQRVVTGKGSASSSVFAYRILIADLVSYRESMAQAGQAPADIGDQLRAAAALSRAAEFVGLQQVAALRAAEAGQLTPAAAQEFTAARTGYADAELTFGALATPQWRQWLEQALTGSDMVAAQRSEDNVARLQPGDRVEIDNSQWNTSTTNRLRRLRDVEQRIDAEITNAVTRLRNDQVLLAAIQSGAVVATVIVLLTLAVWLGRPMIRGLRQLRDTAHQVAYFQLPAAVEKLRDETNLGEMSPRQFADNLSPPVPVRGRDELSEVGSAFNSVHRAAVRVAAEQAMMRVGIAAMLVNLARRGMGLADRLTAELDQVERDERDPDRLAALFRLDLLTTLLRRTNHSLLVLGGDQSARARSSDEPLSTVIRAAQGQIEQYDRVELAAIDDVMIRAKAVDDLAKLMAELMDNACRYAPPLRAHDGLPRPDVVVFARLLGDRVNIQVIDEGVGIEPERMQEFNRRMAGRPLLDLTAVRAMGLTVVAELAARHGIGVHLRPGSMRGTVAEITLRDDLFVQGMPSVALVGSSGAGTVAVTKTVFRRTATAAPPAPLFRAKPAQIAAQEATQTAPHYGSQFGSQFGSQPGSQFGAQPVQYSAPQVASHRSADEPDGRPPGINGVPAIDDTLELPIFRQVASKWFTRPDTVPETLEGPEQPRVAVSWESPADLGWEAARKAAEPSDGGTTSVGLPKRVPKAHLVPGSVEEQDPVLERPRPTDYRDPTAAGATLAAYARGLTRSRLGRSQAPSIAVDDNQGASA